MRPNDPYPTESKEKDELDKVTFVPSVHTSILFTVDV
jgi:hypothetical protein